MAAVIFICLASFNWLLVIYEAKFHSLVYERPFFLWIKPTFPASSPALPSFTLYFCFILKLYCSLNLPNPCILDVFLHAVPFTSKVESLSLGTTDILGQAVVHGGLFCAL